MAGQGIISPYKKNTTISQKVYDVYVDMVSYFEEKHKKRQYIKYMKTTLDSGTSALTPGSRVAQVRSTDKTAWEFESPSGHYNFISLAEISRPIDLPSPL